MTLLILVAAAALWLWSARSAEPSHVRLAAAVQTAGVVTTLIVRQDLPPAGWASAAVLAVWLPGALAAIRPAGAFGRAVRAPQALLTLASALWSAAVLGPGVAMWAPWAWPHIALSVLGLGSAAGAALIALQRVRGRAVPLLTTALVLTAAPLLGPRADTVQVYTGGEPAQVTVQVDEPTGGQGIVRTLPARASLPGERTLRWVAVGALLFGAFLAMAGIGGPVRRLVLGGAGVHALWLASALIPRGLGIEAADIARVAHETLQLELDTVQRVGAITFPEGPFTGGPGSVALLLPLAVAALGLIQVAFASPAQDDAALQRRRRRAEAILAMGAALLLAAGAAAGMAWSNFRWGGPVVADPKVYAVIVSLGLYGLYFLLRNLAGGTSRGPAWVALIALAVLLLSMFGPDLGWIAPGLHHFGA